MNKAALTKHEIYNKLIGFSEKDLKEIARYIDFLRYKNQPQEKKAIKLEGILKEYDLDFSDLKQFKQDTWKHVDQELTDE